VETQTPTSNTNGLVSIEIGGGTVLSGNFTNINWANGPYFVKTETDPTGGTSYSITGTSQLLSVPYAFHANTADSLIGKITETDPIFGASVAYNIKSADTSNWNNKQNLISAGANITISGNKISASGNGIYTHFIGELFGGGVIFHLWKDSMGVEHGLILDKTDLSTSQNWSNINTSVIGVTAQSSWDGLKNSNAIVGQAGHTGSAAKLSLDLIAGGQSDWFLPSIQELNMLWNNYYTIARSLAQISGATPLEWGYYWSSTEEDSTNAWAYSFATGQAGFGGKDLLLLVRAVRAF
jgi:hypothetical protein